MNSTAGGPGAVAGAAGGAVAGAAGGHPYSYIPSSNSSPAALTGGGGSGMISRRPSDALLPSFTGDPPTALAPAQPAAALTLEGMLALCLQSQLEGSYMLHDCLQLLGFSSKAFQGFLQQRQMQQPQMSSSSQQPLNDSLLHSCCLETLHSSRACFCAPLQSIAGAAQHQLPQLMRHLSQPQLFLLAGCTYLLSFPLFDWLQNISHLKLKQQHLQQQPPHTPSPLPSPAEASLKAIVQAAWSQTAAPGKVAETLAQWQLQWLQLPLPTLFPGAFPEELASMQANPVPALAAELMKGHGVTCLSLLLFLCSRLQGFELRCKDSSTSSALSALVSSSEEKHLMAAVAELSQEDDSTAAVGQEGMEGETAIAEDDEGEGEESVADGPDGAQLAPQWGRTADSSALRSAASEGGAAAPGASVPLADVSSISNALVSEQSSSSLSVAAKSGAASASEEQEDALASPPLDASLWHSELKAASHALAAVDAQLLSYGTRGEAAASSSPIMGNSKTSSSSVFASSRFGGLISLNSSSSSGWRQHSLVAGAKLAALAGRGPTTASSLPTVLSSALSTGAGHAVTMQSRSAEDELAPVLQHLSAFSEFCSSFCSAMNRGEKVINSGMEQEGDQLSSSSAAVAVAASSAAADMASLSGMRSAYEKARQLELKLSAALEGTQRRCQNMSLQLQELSDKSESLKEELEAVQTAHTSSDKVQKARASLLALRREMASMELRCGVLQTTVLRKSLQLHESKRPTAAAAGAFPGGSAAPGAAATFSASKF